MNKYDYKQLTIKDITEINNIFREEQDKWDKLESGLHFVVSGTHGYDEELFHHEIISIDKINRVIEAFDYSRDKKVVQIKFLENEYLTLEEFNKKYKNR